MLSLISVRDLWKDKYTTYCSRSAWLLACFESRVSQAVSGAALPPPALSALTNPSTDPLRYSRAMLINNAGSLGHISFANELPSLAALRSEMDFNVTSAFWLSSRFTAIFGAKKSDQNGGISSPGEGGPAAGALDGDGDGTEGVEAISSAAAASVGGGTTRDVSNNVLVNVSSLAALQPFESWSGYSSGKAARDMFHR